MKKTTYFLTTLSISAMLFMSSCSKDSDCHECHIAYMNSAQQEVEVEIGEFCGSELEDVEAPGYTHTIEETIIGLDTVPAGTYSDIHCEEHAHD